MVGKANVGLFLFLFFSILLWLGYLPMMSQIIIFGVKFRSNEK